MLAVALASWASADTGPRAPALEADTWPAAPALGEPTPSLPPFRDPDARRPVPDYDGLPPRDPDPLDLALAFPRALMRPVHLLLEQRQHGRCVAALRRVGERCVVPGGSKTDSRHPKTDNEERGRERWSGRTSNRHRLCPLVTSHTTMPHPLLGRPADIIQRHSEEHGTHPRHPSRRLRGLGQDRGPFLWGDTRNLAVRGGVGV